MMGIDIVLPMTLGVREIEIELKVHCFRLRDNTTMVVVGDDDYYVDTDGLRMFCRAVLAALETKELGAEDN
jgi:hypothetical protein